MKAAPPFSPATYGKRQMLPSPITEPPTAAIVPKRLANDPLFISAVQIRFGHAEREFCKDSKIVPFLSAMRVVK